MVAESTGIALAVPWVEGALSATGVVPSSTWPSRLTDGRRAVVHLVESSASGGEGAYSSEFTSELRVSVGVLPSDGRLTLVGSWPQAGLGEGAVTLTLASLDGLEDRVVHLPVEA